MWSDIHDHYSLSYVKGDLVVFTGYLYTPDYIYIDQYDRNQLQVGIVLGTSQDGHYENVLYRVHWLRTNRISEVVAGHLRLAYTQK